MDLGVQWDRVDLIEELLRQEGIFLPFPLFINFIITINIFNLDPSVTSNNKTDAINKALHLALSLNKYSLFLTLIFNHYSNHNIGQRCMNCLLKREQTKMESD